MISSGSSSGRGRGLGVLLALALLAGGCAHGRRADAPPRRRIALFPIQNVSGGEAPTRHFATDLEVALRAKGIDVASGDLVERVLAGHRIRYTAGLDREAAKALREELSVDGVLIASVEFYGATSPPKLAVTARLVSTDDEPVIEWIDGFARTGDDSLGLFGIGAVKNAKDLEHQAVGRFASSLDAFLDGKDRRTVCSADGRFGPRVSYRSALLDDPERRSIAVLPFINLTDRRDAGEAVVLELLRQLAASRRFEVVEPGLVRAGLLNLRVIMEGGISLDTAQIVLEKLGADLVISGYVRQYDDAAGAGVPRIDFTVYVLDRTTGEVVWSSSSRSEGDDGVLFFDAGKVRIVTALACRMTSSIVERMTGDAKIEATRRGGESRASGARALRVGARSAR